MAGKSDLQPEASDLSSMLDPPQGHLEGTLLDFNLSEKNLGKDEKTVCVDYQDW